MSLSQDFLNELSQESIVTRRYLASVPFDKADFKPHPKSEDLRRLAIHVAEIFLWWKSVLQSSEMDFEHFVYEDIQTNEALLAYFDQLLLETQEALKATKDELFEESWSMRYGETVYFTLPKKQVLRTFCMNHLVHHRAQLGVYLRLLDIVVPAVYGPSADDDEVLLIEPYF